jgi:hypothetical protein
MSVSRGEFIQSHRALSLAVQNQVTFDSPTDPDHDLCAKLFRSSLAVSVFLTLETFIKERTAEVLASIDHQRINFSWLPEGIQRAATFGAVKALNFRLQMLDKSLKQQFAISEAANIASVGSTAYTLSGLSFGHDKSNLNSEDIDVILSSFGVDSGWGKIKIIAGRVGFGGAGSYEETFKNLALRRHLSAHTTGSQVSQSDLIDSIIAIYAIAISFDLIISRCLQLIKSKDLIYLGRGNKKFSLDPSSLPISVMEFSSGKWRFKPSGAKRSTKSDVSSDALFGDAKNICDMKKSALVEIGSNGQPNRWYC